MTSAKDVVRRMYLTYETGELTALDDTVGVDYLDHNPVDGQQPGRDGLAAKIADTRAQLRDVRVEFLDQIEEGDRVASRLRLTGSADGTPVLVELIAISQLADGLVVAEWGQATTSIGDPAH